VIDELMGWVSALMQLEAVGCHWQLWQAATGAR